MNDFELLARFAAQVEDAEDAFTEIVNRHLGLVYSASLRQIGDPHLAQEVTQAVFILLARKAKTIIARPGSCVPGWLYQATRFAARDALRSRQRREFRERKALEMETSAFYSDPPPDENGWDQIAPFLDEAMSTLGQKERTAVLLRYFENKSLYEVGSAIGTSPDSARMRVTRALEKLRKFLTRRVGGETVLSAAGIASQLASNAVHAAPTGMAATITSNAILHGATIPLTTFAIVKSTANAMAWAKLKFAVYGTALALTTATGVIVAETVEQSRPPDPVQLLRRVAKAREAVASRQLDFTVTRYDFTQPQNGTNQLKLQVVFRGQNRRFEEFDTEYAYVMMGPDADSITDAKIKELGLDRQGSVAEGLLKAFQSHRVTAYDGSAILAYSETDGGSFQTDIFDPKSGSANYLFDPRTFGISTTLVPDNTVERCLGTNGVKDIKLVGKEDVRGHLAWHVRLQMSWGGSKDFWMDAAVTEHVVRCDFNGDTLIAIYDPKHPSDPLPVEVFATDYYTKDRERVDTHFIRTGGTLNANVDPASWTLAGLKMQPGTAVSDARIHSRIGYWTGTELAEDFPRLLRTEGRRVQAQPTDPETMLSLARKDPKSEFALGAATWVILNTPDGPAMDEASEMILQNHIRSTNLVYLCSELTRVRPRSMRGLLEAILANNANRPVLASASFALGTLLKDQADQNGDKALAARAADYFERVTTEFSDIRINGELLAAKAEPELREIRKFGIGMMAPDIVGEDLDGRKLALSDFRGKTVVLVFWGSWCGPCMEMIPEERKLADEMTGRRFAIVGVDSDRDAAKAKLAGTRQGMNWPSYSDREPADAIANEWNVHSWPAVFVLDEKGIICHHNLRGKELADAVRALVR